MLATKNHFGPLQRLSPRAAQTAPTPGSMLTGSTTSGAGANERPQCDAQINDNLAFLGIHISPPTAITSKPVIAAIE
jgi:hypothetical protein